MANKKNQSINPIREAQRELKLYLMLLRAKYELHTNDIPDLLDAASIEWFIGNCKAEFIFKQHGIEGYENAVKVYSPPIDKKPEPEPLVITGGLFRSIR